jgi:hypothetical protein
MGCDIHPVLEKRWGDKWVGLHAFPYRTLNLTLYPHLHPKLGLKEPVEIQSNWVSYRAQERNYQLFALLAGVRGRGATPRGLPEDVSDLARAMSSDWGSDGHSHSWVTAREWIEACWQCEQDHAKLFLAPAEDDPRRKNAYQHYLELDCSEGSLGPNDSPDNYRIVFWFDN